MRKLMLLSVAALLILGLGVGTAFADVTVTATIDKDKDMTVTETLSKVKVVNIDVDVSMEVNKAAESEALINQDNSGNYACENCAEKQAEIIGSVLDNLGIVTFNQAAGNMANQGNAVSVAVDSGTSDGDEGGGGTPGGEANGTEFGYAEAQAAADQVMTNNEINSIQILFRDALISGSIQNNSGIVQGNQAVGNMANQANALSGALSLAEPGVALSEADLGQVNGPHESFVEYAVYKTAKLENSIINNTGIVQVNQSSGNNANQANLVAVSAALAGL